MDSKLVVEQMSGNWKIKHPDMRPLALEANRLAPSGTTYTWVPREQNKHADRLANEALDGKRNGVTVAVREQDVAAHRGGGRRPRRPSRAGSRWRRQVQTTLVLVRHGVTDHTRERRFSGGLRSTNPGLSDEGRDQIRATADWLAPLGRAGRRRGRLARTPRPRVRRDPRRAPRRCRSRTSRLRRDGVRHLGRPDLRRGGRAASGRRWRSGSARWTSDPAAASRCVMVQERRAGRARPPARAATPDAPWSSPATSPRSRWSSPRRCRRR